MKTTRKALCCLLAALMTLLSVSAVVAYAADSGCFPDDAQRLTDSSPTDAWEELDYDKHPITAAQFSKLIAAAQEEWDCINSTAGNKYYLPAVQELEDALDAAKALAADENATFNAITLAYMRLYQALIADKDAHHRLDESALTAIWQYTRDLREQHADAFDKANLQILGEVETAAQNGYLYELDTQPKVNAACDDFFKRLKKVETLGEADGFIPPKKYAGIYTIVLAAVPKEDEWDAYRVIGYTPLPGVYNGYYLVSARSAMEQPATQFAHIGDYIYEDVNYYYPSDLGYLLVNPDTGVWSTLEDGVSRHIISGDTLYGFYREGRLSFQMSLAGDGNRDDRLDISDVTDIQKKLAQYADTAAMDERRMDFNGDKKLDISDATAVQRRLAGFDEEDDLRFWQPDAQLVPSVDTKDNAPYFSELHLIRSVEELDAVFDDLGERIDCFHTDIAAVRAKYAAYDAQFFRSRALIIWDSIESGAMTAEAAYHLDAVRRSGSTLYIEATHAVSATPEPISTLYLLAYSVRQSYVAGITALEPHIETFCFGNDTVPFTLLDRQTEPDGAFEHQDVLLIRSREELGGVGINFTDAYDDAFFAENALVVWRAPLGYCNTSLYVNAMYRTADDRLLVQTVEQRPSIMLTVLSYNFVICSVKQEDVAGITEAGYMTLIEYMAD